MGANHSDSEEQLESVLGTKEYWDDRYKLELENYNEIGDEGEIWFGRSAENRAIRYLIDIGTPKDSSIIDLGCGNGSLLRHLRKLKFINLHGVDYCEDAIHLAKTIADKEAHCTNDIATIHFSVKDLLEENTEVWNRYDIVMDKGTWDAMSLSADKHERLCRYRNSILQITNPNGLFIIFSCNFTRDELREQFECEGLVLETEIASAKSIAFGGKSGVTSTGAVFRRRIDAIK